MTPQRIVERLKDLNIVLPSVTPPVANYVPCVLAGGFLYVSGQLPSAQGQMTTGHLGKTLSVEDGYTAARLCAINILAQVAAALNGDWSRLVRCVRIGGFVASTPEFTAHPAVVNGASDLMVAVFEDQGKHARAAVGVPSLPLGAAVEVEALFEIKP